MNLDSMKEILAAAKRERKEFWEIVLETDMENRGVSRTDSLKKMSEVWHAMREASQLYTGERRSLSGLVGGQGKQMREYAAEKEPIGGDFIAQVIAEALSMGESNACMRRIVAAPTAGSCGVVPAVLLSLEQEKGYAREEMIKSLYVCAGIGGVIAQRASISGAAGGCQAEIGAASAMAAGGVAFLCGGSGEAICHAAALAMKNLLGLACDPVGGLVEVPCIKRNVCGAVNALTSADLAIAGIRSRIPPDEVFDAMRSIGRLLPEELRETGRGGLAATPTGIAFREGMETF